MPNAVVYGPNELGGIGLRTLSVERGISQTYLLLACLRSPGVPAKLANIAISWAQFLAGTCVDFRRCHHFASSSRANAMIPQVRKFLHSTSCQIELETKFLPPLQRDNDRYLMDIVLESQIFTKVELLLVNACRIYMGVTLLSDIITPDGTKLSKFVLEHRQDTFSTHNGLLPYQELPGPRAWTQWNKMLNLIREPGEQHLSIPPLGHWIVHGHETYRHWFYFVDCQSSTLFVANGDNSFRHYWYQHPFFLPTSQVSPRPPSTSVPVHVAQSGPALVLSPCRPQLIPQSPPPPQSFSAYVKTLKQWDQHLLAKVDLIQTVEAIQQYFQSSTVCLFLCSDGSAALFRGKFGCICSTDTGQRLFKLHGPAPGFRTSSFRSESYGMLALFRTVLHLTTHYRLSFPPPPIAFLHRLSEFDQDSGETIGVDIRHPVFYHGS